MIRLRGAYVLLLLVGLLGSILSVAVLLPKLAHLGPPPPAIPNSTGHRAHHVHHGWFTFGHLLVLIVLASGVIGVLAAGWWTARVIRRRLASRLTRVYGLYEIRLSMHDQARAQDVMDMTEALLNAVRAFPEDRARNGQPFLAFEAHYAPGPTGEMEWFLCLRCEPDLAPTIDGIISCAYPDVRVGFQFTGPPTPVAGTLPIPGHVLRFRKARSFLYPSAGEIQDGAAQPLEAIAQTQAAVGRPSTVRIQITPCALTVERLARELLRLHEDRLRDHDGALGTLDCGEMTSTADVQRHAWCWLEVQVAAESRETANRIAAALQGRRASNRLQRRWMILRQDLYRQRFPSAYPPLLPALTLRTLATTGEVAQLIALPGARMKNVPVRRLALPRIPAPPEIGMAPKNPTPKLPPQPATTTEDR